MSDLISRQAAIDAISNYTVSSPPYFSAWTDRLVSAIKDDLVDDIENIYTAQQWIPVSERLPEEKFSVLVWCPAIRCIFCAYRQEGKWWIFGASHAEVLHDVTAWIHMPEPYKED